MGIIVTPNEETEAKRGKKLTQGSIAISRYVETGSGNNLHLQ